jgi:hypothetical protein
MNNHNQSANFSAKDINSKITLSLTNTNIFKYYLKQNLINKPPGLKLYKAWQ